MNGPYNRQGLFEKNEFCDNALLKFITNSLFAFEFPHKSIF